jgi:hypothetical protein
MKLIIERENGNAKLIRAEYTPAEALVINHAMRRYTYMDQGINEKSRSMMEKMLQTQPEFIEVEPVNDNGSLKTT